MPASALVLVLFAACAHAAWNILAHGVSRIGVPFLWWAALVATLLWLPVIPFTGGLGGGDSSGFLLGVGVSGVLHIGYMIVLQRGYAVGRLSTVYATARGTGPAISVIAAVTLLGESLSPLAVAGVAVVIAGVVAFGLLDRPTASDDARSLRASILWGLLTGVGIAIYTVWDANAVRTWAISPVAFMVGTTAIEVLLYSAMLGRRRRELPGVLRAHWWKVLAFGALSPLSYILVLEAVRMAPVALVAPVREVSVVLVGLFGAFVLREGRPWRRMGAAVVVLVGVLLLAG